MSYAQNTKVDALNSQAEILRILHKNGVVEHAFGNAIGDDGLARSMVTFRNAGIAYRIAIIMPDEGHEAFTHSETGRPRVASAAENAWKQECRRRWRSMVLLIKAKLVAVDDGITEFEEEFMPYAVTDTGETIAERILPSMKATSLSGGPLALPGRVK